MQQAISYNIVYLYTKDFPGKVFPLVLLSDGKAGYTINQWIYSLMERETTQSTLDRKIRSVMHLHEFYERKYGKTSITKNQAVNLVHDFLKAKRDGNDSLGWTSNKKTSTLKSYLRDINEFDKWHALFHGAEILNPHEERFMSAWEIYADFQQREKWDPMLHLFSAKSHKKIDHKYIIPDGHKRFKSGRKPVPKSFPIDRFVDLIETTPNPRDQMLFLLMGGASLRKSETLHIYYQDILGVDENGTTRVRLDDPETGQMEWNEGEKSIIGTRRKYLSDYFKNDKFRYTNPQLFQLKPRTEGKKGNDHAGFKGMTFSDNGKSILLSDGRFLHTHEAFWIDPRFGIRFDKAYQEYVREYFFHKPTGWPYHPWLFITTKKCSQYGMPMTISALDRAWKRALNRLGLGNLIMHPHSLRHMFGNYAANIVNLPIEITRTAMHHASITSTEVYYSLKNETVRDAIIEGIKHSEINPLESPIMPNTQKLELPSGWNNEV